MILFGATGMIGQGVLRECLRDPEVEAVLAIGRGPSGQQHPKLRDLVHADLLDLRSIEGQLSGYDACFFCLGVSSAGMTEEAYMRVTHGIALAAAGTLAKLNPQMTFVLVTGAGTDSSEKGRSMWARVKGKTENDVGRLPFKAAYMFRPGFIQPLHGIKSRTAAYRIAYSILWPLMPVAKALFPRGILTTEQLGRAMLAVAKRGAPKRVLEMRDIAALGA